MSLKDLLALADDKLHDVFHTKPHDPTKARERHVKSLDLTAKQFGNPEPTKGRKSWKASNNVVQYESGFTINGKTTHYVPSERFGDFIDKLKNLVTKGEFDTDIEAAGKAAGLKPTATRKPREGGGAGWSPERRERFAASIAARKAAKK